jgi:hypothetical protein
MFFGRTSMLGMRLTVRLPMVYAMVNREVPAMVFPDPRAPALIFGAVRVEMVIEVIPHKAVAEKALLIPAAAVPVEAAVEVAARRESGIVDIRPDLDSGLNFDDSADDDIGGRRLFDYRNGRRGLHVDRSRRYRNDGRPDPHVTTPYQQ